MTLEIRLQPKQELFLSASADIVIGGGAAGGGKSFALTIEPLRHLNRDGFNSAIFRRTYPEIKRPGGLWDEAMKIYPLVGLTARENRGDFVNGKVKYAYGYLLNDKALENWRGSQLALLMFDQLETFTEKQFFYMLSRNRTTCGIRSYVRATANPEPGWLAELISWWIADDGFADMSRVGKTRAFTRVQETIYWADTKEELIDRFGKDHEPKSVTYIPFTIYDNPILLETDPSYLASLKALNYVDRMRLLGDPVRGGNWKIKPSAGKVFNMDWFQIVDDPPPFGLRCRYFDTASTSADAGGDPDYTCGIEMVYDGQYYYVTQMFHDRLSAAETDRTIDGIILGDQVRTVIDGRYFARWEIEPGSAARRDSIARATRLAGIDARGVNKNKSKMLAWKPLAAAAEQGLVKLVKAYWNDTFLNELHGVPESPHDDIADAAAGAFTELVKEASTKLVARQERY